MKIGRYLLGVALIVGAVLGWRYWRRGPTAQEAVAAGILPTYDDSAFNTRVPEGTTITVEVLNASDRTGIGRRATLYLRDRGFDVVYTGNAYTGNPPKLERRAQTLVLDRSGATQKAALLAKAMRGRVEYRPDTSRYLDATVLIGSDWSPPPLPLYP